MRALSTVIIKQIPYPLVRLGDLLFNALFGTFTLSEGVSEGQGSAKLPILPKD
jgi:hypothetical protein